MSFPSINASEDRGDLPLRLAALRQQVESGNPEHYRQLALYLQVLRRVLPGAVDQACFHLATQIAPDRYAALPSLKRQALHRRLDELVRQCSSLLTVEQLACLATRLAEDKLRARLKRRRRWLDEHGVSAADAEPATPHQRGDRNDRSASLPSGSVVLGLELPLGEQGGWSQIPMDPADFQQDQNDARRAAAADEDDDDDASSEAEFPDDEDVVSFPWDLAFGLAGAGGAPLEPPEGASEAVGNDRDGAAWSSHPRDASGHGVAGFGLWEPPSPSHSSQDPLAVSPEADEASPTGDDQLRLLRASLATLAAAAASEGFGEGASGNPVADASAARGLPPLPWRSGALPKDPAQWLLWIEGFEQALSRRLRNLSHAINVEFLRQDLSATLLPPSLLDAVLAGRLETQSAPANLLRLSLPLPAAASPQGLVGHALLLRCGDLEGEHPQLRTCRQRLQRLRQELRKMALLQTRLQQRLRTQEAERLWMQTVRRTRTDSR
ncbi:MAG: hypothetical protein VKI42_09505 [Synechococcaceae cyanobacterium]|nr:hypothetical protein [Synechococcaceae cyanobacterium]